MSSFNAKFFFRSIRNPKPATYTYIRKRQQKGPEVTIHTYPQCFVVYLSSNPTHIRETPYLSIRGISSNSSKDMSDNSDNRENKVEI